MVKRKRSLLKPHGNYSKYDSVQLDIGVFIELEHTDNVCAAKQIASHHLDEIPDYYSRLINMETTADIEKLSKLSDSELNSLVEARKIVIGPNQDKQSMIRSILVDEKLKREKRIGELTREHRFCR